MKVDSGTGRIAAAQPDVRLWPQFAQGRNPAVHHHGAANTAQSELAPSTPTLPAVRALNDRLVTEGFLICATTATQQWGNDIAAAAGTGRTRLAVDDCRANGAHATKKAIYVGDSHGVAWALKAACNDPAGCACIVGVIPAISLTTLYSTNFNGVAEAAIGDAYGGVRNPAPLPAGADPVLRTADLAGIPIQLWYSTDDGWSADVPAFAAAVGADLHSLGALGHTNAAVAAVDLNAVVAFVEAHA